MLWFWEGVPLFRVAYGSRIAKSENCCCTGVTICGCENLPTTLYVCNADDDSLLAVLTYIEDLPDQPEGTPGWHNPGMSLAFFCTSHANGGPIVDYWDFDDAEGGTAVEYPVDECDGVLATFDSVNIDTGGGMDTYEIYVTTEPCTG